MRIPRVMLFVLAAALLGGCEKPATVESLMEQKLSTMEEFVTTMRGITDAKSAETAKPKLVELRKKMNGLEEKSKKADRLPKEQMDQLVKKYEERQTEVTKNMLAEGQRLKNNPDTKDFMKQVDDASQ